MRNYVRKLTWKKEQSWAFFALFNTKFNSQYVPFSDRSWLNVLKILWKYRLNLLQLTRAEAISEARVWNTDRFWYIFCYIFSSSSLRFKCPYKCKTIFLCCAVIDLHSATFFVCIVSFMVSNVSSQGSEGRKGKWRSR